MMMMMMTTTGSEYILLVLAIFSALIYIYIYGSCVFGNHNHLWWFVTTKRVQITICTYRLPTQQQTSLTTTNLYHTKLVGVNDISSVVVVVVPKAFVSQKGQQGEWNIACCWNGFELLSMETGGWVTSIGERLNEWLTYDLRYMWHTQMCPRKPYITRLAFSKPFNFR